MAMLSLFVVGCSKPKPPKTSSKKAPPPTKFFDWCNEEYFGIESPQYDLLSVGNPGVPQFPVGDIEFVGWTNCDSDSEANDYLANIEHQLKKKAAELGVELNSIVSTKDKQFEMEYQTARLVGTLKGAMEQRDNKESSGIEKRYFVVLRLTENAKVEK